MAIYRCRFCGSIYDEKKEEVPVSDPKVCPVCMAMAGKPVGAEDGAGGGKTPDGKKEEPVKKQETRETCKDCDGSAEEVKSYNPEHVKTQTDVHYMDRIYEVIMKGQFIITTTRTQTPMSDWDGILFLGTRLNPTPLDRHAPVKTETIIGKHAAKPMVLGHPIYISHMSFGALSRETKTALSKGSIMAHIAVCLDEGDVLPEEKAAAHKYIFEYVPNQYSVTDENLRKADATEIEIRRDTKPGIGDHLSRSKVTPEVAVIRNKPLGQDIISPSRFPGIDAKEGLKGLVGRLRLASDGRPIGIKITTGRIEKDLEFCVYIGPDFITIDGRGGATGASLKIIRNSTSVPMIYILYRVRKYLGQTDYGAQLVITDGLWISSDLAKVLAMGVDVMAIASAALMVAVCRQYRICGTGVCPVDVATQDGKLRSRFKENAAVQRVANFLRASLEEIKTFARITGYGSIHDTDADDLCTASREISEFINIRRA